MPLVLDGTNGVSGVDGTASNPSYEGTDSNTGIFFPAADTVAIGTGGTEALRVNSSQSLLLNTTSAPAASAKMKIATSARTGAFFDLTATGGENWIIDSTNTTGSTDVLGIYANGATGLYLQDNGNVGIGTTSPSTYGKFVTYSSGGYCAIDGNGFVNSYQLLDVTTAGGRLNGGSSQGLLGSIGIEQAATGAKGGYISFRTCPSGSNSDTERARITSDGYSRFADNGTYSYAGTAHTINNSASNDIVRFFNSNATPYGIFVKYTAADPNNTTSYVFAAEQNTGVNIYKIWSNGTVTARSDAKWKKNIETARDGYAEDLAKLRVVKYNWYNHDDGTPKELGLIAQEVEQVFPGLVITDEQTRDEVNTREVPAVLDEEGNEVEPARTEEYTEKVGTGEYSKSIKFSVLPIMLLKAHEILTRPKRSAVYRTGNRQPANAVRSASSVAEAGSTV
jgi:hypothetical protein